MQHHAAAPPPSTPPPQATIAEDDDDELSRSLHEALALAGAALARPTPVPRAARLSFSSPPPTPRVGLPQPVAEESPTPLPNSPPLPTVRPLSPQTRLSAAPLWWPGAATSHEWAEPPAWEDDGGSGGSGGGNGAALEGDALEAALEAALEEATAPLLHRSWSTRQLHALRRWHEWQEQTSRLDARTAAAGQWLGLRAGWRRLRAVAPPMSRATATRPRLMHAMARLRLELAATRAANGQLRLASQHHATVVAVRHCCGPLATLREHARDAATRRLAVALVSTGRRRACCALAMQQLRMHIGQRRRRPGALTAAAAMVAEWRRRAALGTAVGGWQDEATARRERRAQIAEVGRRRRHAAFDAWRLAAAAVRGASVAHAPSARQTRLHGAWRAWQHRAALGGAAGRAATVATRLAVMAALRGAWTRLRAAAKERQVVVSHASRAVATADVRCATRALACWHSRARGAASRHRAAAAHSSRARLRRGREALLRWRQPSRPGWTQAAMLAAGAGGVGMGAGGGHERRAMRRAWRLIGRAAAARRGVQLAGASRKRQLRSWAWARWVRCAVLCAAQQHKGVQAQRRRDAVARWRREATRRSVVEAASDAALSGWVARQLGAAWLAWQMAALRTGAVATALDTAATAATLRRSRRALGALHAAAAARARSERRAEATWRARGRPALRRWHRRAGDARVARLLSQRAEWSAAVAVMRRWRRVTVRRSGAEGAALALRAARARRALGAWRRRASQRGARAAAVEGASRLPRLHGLARWRRAAQSRHADLARRRAAEEAALLVWTAETQTAGLARWREHVRFEQSTLDRWRRPRLARRGWAALVLGAARAAGAARLTEAAEEGARRSSLALVMRRLRRPADSARHAAGAVAATAAMVVEWRRRACLGSALGGWRRAAASLLELDGRVALMAVRRRRGGWEAWRCALLRDAVATALHATATADLDYAAHQAARLHAPRLGGALRRWRRAARRLPSGVTAASHAAWLRRGLAALRGSRDAAAITAAAREIADAHHAAEAAARAHGRWRRWAAAEETARRRGQRARRAIGLTRAAPWLAQWKRRSRASARVALTEAMIAERVQWRNGSAGFALWAAWWWRCWGRPQLLGRLVLARRTIGAWWAFVLGRLQSETAMLRHAAYWRPRALMRRALHALWRHSELAIQRRAARIEQTTLQRLAALAASLEAWRWPRHRDARVAAVGRRMRRRRAFAALRGPACTRQARLRFEALARLWLLRGGWRGLRGFSGVEQRYRRLLAPLAAEVAPVVRERRPWRPPLVPENRLAKLATSRAGAPRKRE